MRLAARSRHPQMPAKCSDCDRLIPCCREPRVAYAQLSHETNVFSSTPTDLAAFRVPAWRSARRFSTQRGHQHLHWRIHRRRQNRRFQPVAHSLRVGHTVGNGYRDAIASLFPISALVLRCRIAGRWCAPGVARSDGHRSRLDGDALILESVRAGHWRTSPGGNPRSACQHFRPHGGGGQHPDRLRHLPTY